MKSSPLHFIATVVYFVLVCSGISYGQSITMGSISGTNFCAGDPISVTFTATGSWLHKNAFTIQLSDPTGSYANTFKNIGSIDDTDAGTFTITATVPFGIAGSTHYRIRISGAKPYTVSADNGQDLSFGTRPYLDLEIADFTTFVTTQVGGLFLPVGARVDSTVQIRLPHADSTASSTTYEWDFGADANPSTASGLGLNTKNVTYASAGDKIVTVKATGPTGCDTTASIRYHVFDCTNPSIPRYASVVSSDALHGDAHGKVIWVNPGVTLSMDLGGKDTLFCESGSSITYAGAYSVIYLKPGASYTENGSYNTIIHGDGVSLEFGQSHYHQVIHCPSLDFDYTNAPPNVAFPSSVQPESAPKLITVFPNPTTGTVSISGLPSGDLTISVMNLLGATLIERKNIRSAECTLDLSTLAPGAYYIRCASANSVTTKAIVKQ